MAYLDIYGGINCCAVVELDHVQGSTVKQCLREVFDATSEDDNADCHGRHGFDIEVGRFVMFSDTDRTKFKYGEALAKALKTNRLGKVTTTGAAVNERTGNKVKVWIWTVNKPALRKYVIEKGWD